MRAILLPLATSTPRVEPIPVLPAAILALVCTKFISCSDVRVRLSPARNVASSPICALTLSLMTDTPTTPPVPEPPAANETIV